LLELPETMTKSPTIYIRRKTQMMLKGTTLCGVRTLQAKEGSRGSWNIAGDENGVYDFPTEESRDAKIAELTASGAVLK
jgi:hypothetical protein